MVTVQKKDKKAKTKAISFTLAWRLFCSLLKVMKHLIFGFLFAFLSLGTFSAQADLYPSGQGQLNCKKTDRNPLKCLVCSMYFEARGENVSGQVDVGRVMITRVLDERYPDTMCEVVWQKSQFSWTKDGLSDVIPGGEVLTQVVESAKQAVNAGPNRWVSYYAAYIQPYWYKECHKRIRRGAHIFCDKGFQEEDSALMIRDILRHLEGKDIPIPRPRPRGPHDVIPYPTMRPEIEQEMALEEEIAPELLDGSVFYNEAAGDIGPMP